jgi:hypothetical protein
VERRRKQIRRELERRGLSPAFSRAVAAQLAEVAPELSPAERLAALDGVVAAYRVHRDAQLPGDAEQVLELKRLVEGFNGELQKLEEGLQILSAYVARMGVRAGRESSGTLH